MFLFVSGLHCCCTGNRLCLPILAVPQPGWTPYPVQLVSEPLADNKPSSLDSDLLLESLTALTPLEEPGGFVYLDSSVPTKMLSPPQRFAGQLSPQLDKVAAPHQAQVSVLLDDVELPVTLIEALTLPPEPSEGAEFFKFQQEVLFPSSEPVQDEQASPSQQESMDGSLQASEESEASSTQWEATAEHLQNPKEVEPSSTPEEAVSQPPELPHEITAQAPGHHEAGVSSPIDVPGQPPAFDSVIVQPPELGDEVAVVSSTEQGILAQSSVSPEQFGPFTKKEEAPTQQPNPAMKDKPSASQDRVPSWHAELPEEHSGLQQESSALSPNFPARGALQSVHHELPAQPQRPSEAPAPPSGPPKELEASAQQMTPPQPIELPEVGKLPMLLPAPSPPPEPPEEVELSPAQAVDPSQCPHEPPSESVAPPPAQYDITVSFPVQNQAVLPPLPSVASDYLDVEATITPVRTTEGELPIGLQRSTAVHARPAEVMLPPPNLILGTVGPLDPELTRTPEFLQLCRSPPPSLQTQLSLSLNLQCLLRQELQVLVGSPLNIAHHPRSQAHLPTWIPAALLCPPQRLHTLCPCRNLQLL
ncbi:Leucine-rich repeat-containing protein 37A [Heterocephalus glaber]|uniref:Leucine-rich repeat-containing protein 37A n=1 Tax=Heterocephalus glaber TaxID=10181 RepID=G5BA89_HETGA|nr:Leucine-rich repeat-containing protein 37A [Heterocephalus glaber]